MSETKIPPSLVKYCFEDDDAIDDIKELSKNLFESIEYHIHKVEVRSEVALRLARTWCIIAGEAKGWTESQIEEHLKDIIGK